MSLVDQIANASTVSLLPLKADRIPLVDQGIELARVMKDLGASTPEQIGAALRLALQVYEMSTIIVVTPKT